MQLLDVSRYSYTTLSHDPCADSPDEFQLYFLYLDAAGTAITGPWAGITTKIRLSWIYKESMSCYYKVSGSGKVFQEVQGHLIPLNRLTW